VFFDCADNEECSITRKFIEVSLLTFCQLAGPSILQWSETWGGKQNLHLMRMIYIRWISVYLKVCSDKINTSLFALYDSLEGLFSQSSFCCIACCNMRKQLFSFLVLHIFWNRLAVKLGILSALVNVQRSYLQCFLEKVVKWSQIGSSIWHILRTL